MYTEITASFSALRPPKPKSPQSAVKNRSDATIFSYSSPTPSGGGGGGGDGGGDSILAQIC